MKRYETMSVSQTEADQLLAEHEREVGPVVRRRYVPRHLAMRMGYERAAAWLDQKEQAEEHHDGAIMLGMLGE